MENKDLSKIKWGEIYTCDLGKMKGSVQCGVRPVLVVQTNKLNGSSPTVVVAVITSVRKREDIASHIPLETDCGLNEPSMVKKNPSEVNGATVEPKKEPQGITEEAMLNYMVQNPDFLQKFKVLLGVGN